MHFKGIVFIHKTIIKYDKFWNKMSTNTIRNAICCAGGHPNRILGDNVQEELEIFSILWNGKSKTIRHISKFLEYFLAFWSIQTLRNGLFKKPDAEWTFERACNCSCSSGLALMGLCRVKALNKTFLSRQGHFWFFHLCCTLL